MRKFSMIALLVFMTSVINSEKVRAVPDPVSSDCDWYCFFVCSKYEDHPLLRYSCEVGCLAACE